MIRPIRDFESEMMVDIGFTLAAISRKILSYVYSC